MPQTETINTEYGEVEAETETCHKCDEKKLAENTLDLLMGKRIRSWSSGDSYPSHRGIVGLEDSRNPEHQIWCLECAEYELGYSTPAGTESRSFPTTREGLKVAAIEHRGAVLSVLSSALTAAIILL